ncbi:hypothetical protein [Shinella sp. HZN7]|uniref:hypothetical protein n=1 Tax=Shinella sp. (strain HZN7) TaxID=879274 RepID=UPI0007DA8DB5|nr:hypothetical protein [Shinella sp. HZN7]ANH08647.1 hypothetical protein shn_31390 [Shinella sp. HZN7]
MLYELIAAVVAGVALAGIAMALRRLTGGLLPKWLVPAAAGIGILGYSVWSEYSWFSRSVAAQPNGVVVAWHNGESAPWRPWSYLAPVTTRFTAVDTRSIQRHPDFPDQRIVGLRLAARWQPSTLVKVAFDCAGNKRADLSGGNVSIGANGGIENAAWIDLAPDDAVLRAACAPSGG